MRKEFYALYDMMAGSNKVENMHVFGTVLKEIMEWMIQNKPELAQQWLEKLESVRWNNYLTPKEAEMIVSEMEPQAPWSREQWKSSMQQRGLPLEKEPCYNSCALYVAMNMKMSDSSATLSKYVDSSKIFNMVHDLAVDLLTDKDSVFNIREYFKV